MNNNTSMRRSFVKTKEEIQQIQEVYNKGRCTIECLTIEFKTTSEFLKEILPPCFDMPDDPIGYVSVSRWQSELCGEYDCGIIAFNCKYKGQEGTTMLSLIVSGDLPVVIGREMWGEAKKSGNCMLYKDGNQIYAYAQRNGLRLIELEAEIDEVLEPQNLENYDFELKAFPHSSGFGLHKGSCVNIMKNEEKNVLRLRGQGHINLKGTDVDPYDLIPIVEVRDATYTEGLSNWTISGVDELTFSDEELLPYIYGQKYDDVRFFRKPKRFEV
ncbi:acetoacetate decarboxylase family protein [Acinetobacter pittii]|uniref:acetoacetate decarboxylase family protein n=1 Tax=Acinetobacter pittii TaxID=48296 RepID=UPI002A036724|nr:acetoacetate decarboxylase family protein [Acinetobacter pittii]MDX8237964.1 acetoacetate decarboxylase family protein [Acinetobacter pittii]